MVPYLTYLFYSKYGEINNRINSLAGPTNRLTHSPTSLNNLEEKFVSLTALPGLLPSLYSDLDPTTSIDDTLHQTTACTNTEAFRRLNGETSRTHTTTTNAGIANVGGTQSITT